MTMEKQPSRRALLRLFGAAPALAILPAGSALALASTAFPAHPDAALFAMQSAIDAADRQLEVAFAVRKPAEEAYFDKRPACPAAPGGPVFSPEEQQALDAFVAKLKAQRERGRPPEWVAYDLAVQDHERETERLKDECGLTAASEMQDAAHETISQLQADLIDTPATTLAGLIFKARYAAAHYSDDYDEDVMISIVGDLLAMAGDSGDAKA
jgi:hypothetical protein